MPKTGLERDRLPGPLLSPRAQSRGRREGNGVSVPEAGDLAYQRVPLCQGIFLDEDLDYSQLAAPLYVQFLVWSNFLHTPMDIAHAYLHIQIALLD